MKEIKELEHSFEHFVVPDGQLTFDAEGTEGGRYHSRQPHVPTDNSGLTLGRGYDMKERSADQVKDHLTRAGLITEHVELYSRAAGLCGQAAREFIARNTLPEITPLQQRKLFIIAYDEIAKDAIRICNKPDVVERYGRTDWENLNKFITDVLVDLRFRGDYTPASRELIQSHIADNNLEKFREAMSEKANWSRVPHDRFQRRLAHLNTASVLSHKASDAAKAAYPTYVKAGPSLFASDSESLHKGDKILSQNQPGK